MTDLDKVGACNPHLLGEKATPHPRHDLVARSSSPVERADQGQPIPPSVPFYCTRKGIVVVVALVVIIFVAVGGGVAGSKKKAIVSERGASPGSISSTSAVTITTDGAQRPSTITLFCPVL
jgi:hypothetical protein